LALKMHEYLNRLLKAQALGLLDAGSAFVAEVAHDDSCGIYRAGDCNCDPDITIRTDKGAVKVLKDGSLKNG